MLIERKHVILSGLFLASVMGLSAWSQNPATQQQPSAPPATNATPTATQTSTPPSDVPPPLKKPEYTKKKKDKKSDGDMPPPLPKPVAAKKKKGEATNSAPAATATTFSTEMGAPVPTEPVAPPIAPAANGTEQPAVTPQVGQPQPVAPQLAAPQNPTPQPVAPEPAAPQTVEPQTTAPQPAVPQLAARPGTSPAPVKKPVVAEKKKGKQPYTGPNTIIELPPTPMLDSDGKQRIDPDGKLMFNPPVKQQRDKNGHPLFDANGKPVFQTATELGYDEKGKKIRLKKEKQPKTTSISIAEGTLTVDGMIGKATLNYEIKDFKFIYMYAPWIGTVVVANQPFPGSKEQPKAFDQHTLTVTVEDHQFQLYSEKFLLGKKPEPAYVAVDREFKLDSKVPAMGYGATLQAPYSWPSAKANPLSKAYVKPPPVPKDLKQIRLLAACPDGMARTGPLIAGTIDHSCAVVDTPKPAETPADATAPAAEASPASALPATPPAAAESAPGPIAPPPTAPPPTTPPTAR